MRVLPHVVGAHRDIQEQHVFEDIMQLVDWVRERDAVTRDGRARTPCHRHHREWLSVG